MHVPAPWLLMCKRFQHLDAHMRCTTYGLYRYYGQGSQLAQSMFLTAYMHLAAPLQAGLHSQGGHSPPPTFTATGCPLMRPSNTCAVRPHAISSVMPSSSQLHASLLSAAGACLMALISQVTGTKLAARRIIPNTCCHAQAMLLTATAQMLAAGGGIASALAAVVSFTDSPSNSAPLPNIQPKLNQTMYADSMRKMTLHCNLRPRTRTRTRNLLVHQIVDGCQSRWGYTVSSNISHQQGAPFPLQACHHLAGKDERVMQFIVYHVAKSLLH